MKDKKKKKKDCQSGMQQLRWDSLYNHITVSIVNLHDKIQMKILKFLIKLFMRCTLATLHKVKGKHLLSGCGD